MNSPASVQAQPAHAPAEAPVADDMAMLRAAAELTRDISTARAALYWPDMLVSAMLGYGALAGAILHHSWAALGCAVVAVLALYRALLLIHELTHIHRDALPGFRFAWNVLVGIPLLTPSFMYENVHSLHHARQRYGTADDPEYLPLALMKPWSLPGFILVALALPFALLFRFAVLVPLGALIPRLRKLAWERASALAINPAFRRRAPEGAFARMVFWQELGGALWALSLVALSARFGWAPLLTGLCVVSGVALLNQLRTLVAHLWQNEGAQMTVTAQYLDSVNVPPTGSLAGIWAELWAPVGLRYHATHHLLPSLPYHSLAEAHRRLCDRFGAGETYHGATYPGLWMLIGRIAKSTMGRRAARTIVWRPGEA